MGAWQVFGVRKKSGKVTRLGVNRTMLLVWALLSGCSQREPDLRFTILSPDGDRTIEVRGFQPRGTIDGKVTVSFDGDDNSATFYRIKNVTFGWTAPNQVSVVGDSLLYRNVSSHYFPDGTVNSEISFVVCARDKADCSSIERRLRAVGSSRRISHFP